MGLIRTLFYVILIYSAIKLIGIVLRQPRQNYNRKNNYKQEEGSIDIDYVPNRKKNKVDDSDYIDYEEL